MAALRSFGDGTRAFDVQPRPSSRLPHIAGFNRCLWCVCGISIGSSRVLGPILLALTPSLSLPLSLFGTPYLEMQEMGERDGGFTSAHSVRRRRRQRLVGGTAEAVSNRG